MVYNVWEKIAENLYFVKNSNLIREKVLWCKFAGKNLWRSPMVVKFQDLSL